jgi:predicted lipid-binding transport protein (Tim44 family)
VIDSSPVVPRKRSNVLWLMGGMGGLLLILLSLLVLAPAAHALGGGGIGGFSDGGGGGGGSAVSGGGGGFGPGGGVSGSGSEEGVFGLAVLARLVVFVLIVLYFTVGMLYARAWHRRRTVHRNPLSLSVAARIMRRTALWPVDLVVERRLLGARRTRVRLASAEASESDARFAQEAVCVAARSLFCAIQEAWSRDDRETLSDLVMPDLMIEWEKRLAGFARRGWSNQIELRGVINTDYVGLKNAAEEESKRAVVRVGARVRDVVVDSHGKIIHRKNSFTDVHNICEYWTLGLHDDAWVVISIEQHHEGLHQLKEPIIASPWSDIQTLQREATLERLAEQKVNSVDIPAVASAEITGDAREAALDLSLVDDRFAPRVVTGEVEHAVRAWAEAIDGKDESLEAIASRDALETLLYPGDPDHRLRLVVRGLRVRAIRIAQLEAQSTPPSLLVEVRAAGRRYVEDRTMTTIVEGHRSLEISFSMRWRMKLTDDRGCPWQISEVTHIL